jgi:hypothetical protein
MEPLFGTFSSSKQQVRIFSRIIFPAARFPPVSVANDLHGSTIRSDFVDVDVDDDDDDDDMRLAVPLRQFPEEFQSCFVIPALGDKGFQHLAFVIYRAPKVMCLSIDLHENLFQVPLPIGVGASAGRGSCGFQQRKSGQSDAIRTARTRNSRRCSVRTEGLQHCEVTAGSGRTSYPPGGGSLARS